MSGAPEHQRHGEVGEAGERRDDEDEDHQRRVHRDEAVERLRVDELHSRLRQLGPEDHRHQPAEDEEDERRHEVLDPDHLVVGVDLEVVLPDVGAVVGVVVGPRRPAGDPVQPVVERAEAEQEPDRRRRPCPPTRTMIVPVVDRDPSRRASGCRRRCRGRSGRTARSTRHARIQPGRIKRPAARCGAPAPWPRSWDVWSTARHAISSLALLPLLTAPCRDEGDEGVDLLAGERVAEVPRHDIRLEAGGDHLVRVDDRLLHVGRGILARLLRVGGDVVEVRPDLRRSSRRA